MWILLALACQSDCSDGASCAFEGGAYTVLGASEPTDRAFIYLHGAATNAEEVRLRHKEERFLEAGYTMVYPDAPSGNWQVSRGLDAAAEDAAWVASLAEQLRVDGVADTFFVGGQSVGGSMTWYVACFEGDGFAGFLPSAGGFWEPLPASCPTRSVVLRHSHGLDDNFVPFEGRELGGGATQGSVAEGLALWRDELGCDEAVEESVEGPFTCEAWTGCSGELELCRYQGGHGTPKGWEVEAVEWLDRH